MFSEQRYCGVVIEYPGVDQPVGRTDKRVRTRTVRSGELGISFIGAGNFARGVLLPIVKRSPGVHLFGIVAATGLSAKTTAEQFGFAHSTTDCEELLGDEESQLVFIATRHDSHAEFVAKALKRNKHVFVEKPLAVTDESLREVVRAARQSNGLLMVGYNRRFAPIANSIKQQFSARAGPMTIIYRVNAGQLPRDHWAHDPEEGGGRIIGEVCHFLDFVQYLTGALPVRVSAEAVPQTPAAGLVDDSTVISMSTADGSIASIVYTASGDSSVAKEHIEIFCDRSVATIDDFKTGTFISDRKKTKLGKSSQDKGHAAEIAAFLDAARQGADPPIELESMVATTLASFAIVESLRRAVPVAVDLRSALSSD